MNKLKKKTQSNMIRISAPTNNEINKNKIIIRDNKMTININVKVLTSQKIVSLGHRS
jgi:hypothetical protein